MAGNQGNNRIIWTEEMNQFLRDNFFKMTNPQLAAGLGLKLTVVRHQCYRLGLKRIEMEYWTNEQLQYLIENYKKKGNGEIADDLNKLFPKKKLWTHNHIVKKMKYLKLSRTKDEIFTILSDQAKVGGRSSTILNNSSSLNMSDSWVANSIAWRNKDLANHIIQNHPNLITVKRAQLVLNRALKQQKK